MKTILMTLILVMMSTEVSAVRSNLADIINGAHRSEEHKARDEYRHPQKTIEFFGTKPTDHVLEMWPGNGWYSEILAPYVKEKGKYTAVTFSVQNLNSDDKRAASWSKTALKFREKMSDSDLYGKVSFTEFEPPSMLKIAKSNSVDAAYIVRVMHIWDQEGFLAKGLKSVYKALKPGGVLAVVQHRGDAVEGIGSSAVEGYLGEQYVIEAAKKAGFKLVASSEINANPKDTKNHPKGVYTLPPMLAMGAKDKERYVEIGESDRMTLKFIKAKK
ncbi:MAG: class I SAM-dependent methyltransferase [Gammaproteobacteria bacterium]|nr:class I SAM-dependent methyltransferase [Gammaproteobacteria bacterium]